LANPPVTRQQLVGGSWQLVLGNLSRCDQSRQAGRKLIGPPWGVADFFLVMIAGIAGAFAAGAVVIGSDLGTGPAVAVSALGMSAGHAVGLSVAKNRRSAKPGTPRSGGRARGR
jgi:hypothetical protein